MSLSEHYKKLSRYFTTGLTNPLEVSENIRKIRGNLTVARSEKGRIVFAKTDKNKTLFEEEKHLSIKYESNMLFRLNKSIHDFYKEMGRAFGYFASGYAGR